MYNDYYGYSTPISSGYDNAMAVGIGAIICIILALVGGIVLYATFLSKKKEGRFTGFLGWLYDFLSFKKLLLETILKIIYLIAACFITLYSLVLLFVGSGNFGMNFLLFIATLVGGNVFTRLIYEFLLLTILICRNVSDINKKMGANKAYQPEMQNNQPYPQHVQPAYRPSDEPVLCQSCGGQFPASEPACPHCGAQKQSSYSQ